MIPSGTPDSGFTAKQRDTARKLRGRLAPRWEGSSPYSPCGLKLGTCCRAGIEVVPDTRECGLSLANSPHPGQPNPVFTGDI